MNWPVFFKRTLSAIVYAIIMLGGLLLPDPFAIIVLALLIMILCIREFFPILELIKPNLKISSTRLILIQLFALALFTVLILNPSVPVLSLMAVPVLLLFFFVMKMEIVPNNFWVAAIVGIFYLVFPVVSLVHLRNLPEIGIWIPTALVVMIWINDTMAYIVGSFIGKHKMSVISPGKTWEGTIGGGLLCIVTTLIWVYFAHPPLSAYFWGILALIAVVVGTLGDLLESKFKRMAGVKDSGNIMPGHGGAFDRFDSLIAALPFALLWVIIWLA